MLLWILLQQGFNQGHGEGTPWCHLPCSITAAARCPLAGETEINLNTWPWEQAQDKGPQLRDHLGWSLKFFNSLKFLILHQLIQSSEERDLCTWEIILVQHERTRTRGDFSKFKKLH